MPDPLTHLCTALLPKALIGGRHTGVFAVGAVLPDLASRLPSTVIDGLIRAGAPLPRAAAHVFTPLHMPFGAALLCVIAATCFPERDRAAVLAWLAGGSALHFATDALQDHHGEGYRLLFPFDLGKYELGWIGSEATVPLAPWLALATAVAWAARWAWERRARGRSGG